MNKLLTTELTQLMDKVVNKNNERYLRLLNDFEAGLSTWSEMARYYGLKEHVMKIMITNKLQQLLKEPGNKYSDFYTHLKDNWEESTEINHKNLINAIMIGVKPNVQIDLTKSDEMIDLIGCNRHYILLMVNGYDARLIRDRYKTNFIDYMFPDLYDKVVQVIIKRIETKIIWKFINYRTFDIGEIKIKLHTGAACNAFCDSVYCDHDKLLNEYILDQKLCKILEIPSIGETTVNHLISAIEKAICSGYKRDKDAR